MLGFTRALSHLTQRRTAAVLALAVAYFVSGRLALMLAVPPGYATAVFPPAGIAMAAMLIGDAATLPGTFIGSLLLNLWIGGAGLHALAAALVVAVASTAQAAIGGRVLRRLIGYPARLDRSGDIARFFLAAPALALIGATIAHAGLALLGAIEVPDLGQSWFIWWIGDTIGVLFFLPLVLVAFGEPRPLWRGRTWSVAAPMLLFFALFVAVFAQVGVWERDRSLVEFRLLSQQVVDKVGTRLGECGALLDQLADTLAGEAPSSRSGFARLARELMTRFPAVKAVEWAPRVDAGRRAEFEAAQRQRFPGYVIRERDELGRMHPAGARPVFYPLTELAPAEGEKALVGFDLGSDPVRRAAIDRAVESGAVTATAPVALLAQPGTPTGVLLVAAVPRRFGGPGVVVLAVRMDALVDALLGPARAMLDVRLVDHDTGQPLYGQLAASAAPFAGGLDFGSHRYDLESAPTALYLSQHRQWQSVAVLVAGVLSASLLGALLLLGTGERDRLYRLAARRTRERDRIWQVSEDLLGVVTFEGRVVSLNPAWTRALGWSADEIKAMHISKLRHPDDSAAAIENRRRLAEGTGPVRMENRFLHKDGSYRWISWTMTAEDGLIYVSGRNITAEKEQARALRQSEENLHQLQKMESIGRLTGGIAHDFNNMLTAIIGNLEITGRALAAGESRARRAVAAATDAATRAVTLTQRLLAYGQKQPLNPRAVDVNKLVVGMSDLIRRTQGETIRYDFALADGLPLCFCDPNQLETVVLNLVINAHDAMPHGGRLEVRTTEAALDTREAEASGVSPGHYVALSVSDTGVGMSPETATRAFEPFFTTKPTGKGTGLGLSMVYGFIKQSKGAVAIDSVVGRGTTIRLLLPRFAADVQAEPVRATASAIAAAQPGHGETVLIAEDDPSVLGYVAETLRELNYHVLEANNAATALEIVAEPGRRIHLLLTDVVMPGINGRHLADQARVLQPDMRVLFMTGYPEDVVTDGGRIEPGIELMQKPFEREQLAGRIRALLDAESPPPMPIRSDLPPRSAAAQGVAHGP